MGENSKIAWTHNTFNPVWGCIEIDLECTFCYAKTLSHRWGFDVWGSAKNTERRTFGDKHWNEPLKWNKEAESEKEVKRVFCGSMCDIMEDHPIYGNVRPKLFELIQKTQNLNWLLLTKRPENFLRHLPGTWLEKPMKNVWHGTSVGYNGSKSRIEDLKKVPAHIRFLSCEPLLDNLILTKEDLKGIHWVIVGGESGAKHRPCELKWIEDIVEACQKNNVPVFVKQMGSNLAKRMNLNHSKGEDIKEFPKHLRIQKFPKS